MKILIRRIDSVHPTRFYFIAIARWTKGGEFIATGVAEQITVDKDWIKTYFFFTIVESGITDTIIIFSPLSPP